MSDLDEEELKATREIKAINKIIAPEEKKYKVKKSNMLNFSERLKLAEKYKEFIKQGFAKKCDFNLITFLSIHELFDLEKVKKYLDVENNE